MNKLNAIKISVALQQYFKKNEIFFLALLVNALLIMVNIFIRPLIPVDETRYISVAWEMNNHSSFVLPLLNQEPYFHKPALLFWIINLFWYFWGHTELVARISIALFSMANLFVVHYLAKLIYPKKPEVQAWAPLLLAGFLLWNIFCGSLMFDCLLTFFVLSYVAALLLFSQGRGLKYVFLAGLLGGLSLLTKGPVALIYSLPVFLLYPLWRDKAYHRVSCKRWYFGVFSSLLIAFLCLFAWALPAAMLGGPFYTNQLLWNQTVDRLSGVIAHLRPWYWYLPFLPLSLIPISLSKNFWKISAIKHNDKSDLFCILWFLIPIILFSIIKSKQLHYLVPTLPALALFFAARRQNWHQSKVMMVSCSILVALACFAIPFINYLVLKNGSLFSVAQLSGLIPLILLGAVLLWGNSTDSRDKMALVGTPICVLALLGSAKPIMDFNLNLNAAAQKIAVLQSQNQEVAVFGNYSGEYHFPGKLTGKVEVVNNFEMIKNLEWLQQHPSAIVLYPGPKNDVDLKRSSIAFYNYAEHETYFITADTLFNLICKRGSKTFAAVCNS